MTDRAIAEIRGVPRDQLSFAWFRARLKADHDLKDSLNFGHAIADSIEQLDQYLYSYGPMIESQWECVASILSDIVSPFVWMDYNCGQGLAGLLASDLTGGTVFGAVADVVLIEPSAPALARAAALYERLAPTARQTCICTKFDDLDPSELPDAEPSSTLHLFSNSLDVLGYDPLGLLSKTLRLGHNTVLSVSHDRGFNGGTPRIEQVKAAFERPDMASQLVNFRSKLEQFTCSNPSRSKGVVWLCEF